MATKKAASKKGKTVEHVRKPSQSEIVNEKRKRATMSAEDKKAKRLERAGTAIIEGKPDKAKKIMKGGKKLPEKQASAVVAEAQTTERRLTAIEHEIDGVSEHLKELRAQKERLGVQLRSEIRDANQGRLDFGGALESTAKSGTSETKGAKEGATPAPAETKGAKGETPALAGDVAKDVVAGLDGPAAGDLDAAEKLASAAPAAAPAPTPEGKGKRRRAPVTTHEAAA